MQSPVLVLQSLPSAQVWPHRPHAVRGAQCENATAPVPVDRNTSAAPVCRSLASIAVSLGGQGVLAALEARSKAASSAGVMRWPSVVAVEPVVGLAVALLVGLVAPLVVEQ
eukprot:1460287-Karenia_brevis.AAC.2